MNLNRLFPLRSPNFRWLTLASLTCGALACLILHSNLVAAQETAPAPTFIWPDLAPGETERHPGTPRPFKRNEKPPINRVANISGPTIRAFLADAPNGKAIVVLPGGGFSIVCDNKEGTEAAPIFNPQGISIFVVNYRVSGDRSDQAWKKPVQDAQRAIRWVRHHAEEFKVDPQKIGIMGFSAGGQAATITTTALKPYYEPVDEIDDQPFAPNFSILVYPWRLEKKDGQFRPMITVTKTTPPTMIIHASDDKVADPAGAARLYLAMQEAGVSSELHIFANGGHGFGFRSRPSNNVNKWPSLATKWIAKLKMTKTADRQL